LLEIAIDALDIAAIRGPTLTVGRVLALNG
jgi:hypothetical protein